MCAHTDDAQWRAVGRAAACLQVAVDRAMSSIAATATAAAAIVAASGGCAG
jgi:hypothetical protein